MIKMTCFNSQQLYWTETLFPVVGLDALQWNDSVIFQELKGNCIWEFRSCKNHHGKFYLIEKDNSLPLPCLNYKYIWGNKRLETIQFMAAKASPAKVQSTCWDIKRSRKKRSCYFPQGKRGRSYTLPMKTQTDRNQYSQETLTFELLAHSPHIPGRASSCHWPWEALCVQPAQR